ncbi:MAG: hypothetical protein IJ191_08910 [Treponema sp.]|nr:hypothetical protein [Treponema sp.]
MIHIYRQILIYRVLKIIGGLFFVFAGLISLLRNEAREPVIFCCSMLSLLGGVCLVVHGVFFKIKVCTDFIEKSVLLPFFKIAVADIENLESIAIGPNKRMSYFLRLKNKKKKWLGSLSMIIDDKDVLMDIYMVVTEHELPYRDMAVTQKMEWEGVLASGMHIALFFVSLCVCGILTFFSIKGIHIFIVPINNRNILKLIVAVVFVVYLIIFTKIFEIVCQRKGRW